MRAFIGTGVFALLILTQLFVTRYRTFEIVIQNCDRTVERLSVTAGNEQSHSHQTKMQGQSATTLNSDAASKNSRIYNIKRTVVLGERNSGTNLIEAILKNNLDLQKIQIQNGITHHKHYFQQPWHSDLEQDLAHTLIIVPVRNPYDWLDAMHVMCYCCETISSIHTSMNEFLIAPFNTTLIDPINLKPRPDENCPIDINPYKSGNDVYFPNIIEARYQKMMHFLNLSRVAAGFEMIQLEKLLTPDDQIDWFTLVSKRFHLPLAPTVKQNQILPVLGDARPWKKETEPSYYNSTHRKATSVYLSKSLLTLEKDVRESCHLKNRYIDEFMEQMMGYQLLDCSENI